MIPLPKPCFPYQPVAGTCHGDRWITSIVFHSWPDGSSRCSPDWFACVSVVTLMIQCWCPPRDMMAEAFVPNAQNTFDPGLEAKSAKWPGHWQRPGPKQLLGRLSFLSVAMGILCDLSFSPWAPVALSHPQHSLVYPPNEPLVSCPCKVHQPRRTLITPRFAPFTPLCSLSLHIMFSLGWEQALYMSNSC